MSEEFYIGWQPKASPGIGKRIGRVIIGLLFMSLLVSVSLALAQRMIGTAVFEYGIEKHFTGIFRVWPYPHLLVPRPNGLGRSVSFSTYFLVAPWKFGLSPEAIAPYDGKFVTLQGTLIYRGSQTMIQVTSSSIKVDQSKSLSSRLPQAIPRGRHTLTGEIIDSKCYLGVMNPGQLAPHRACAILCISGGIPPVLLVRQNDGTSAYVLLVSAAGKPVNRQILDFIAEPVEITGEVESQDGLLVLCADPATYQRVHP